ncbi:MAG TPA: glycosyltransferase family 1 protein [Solirubrobacteraceae bacterium]|jgi:glycosyltransferase involved in cell wall biosynthesis|nr:glycosyltransferase family 1 protein [Solirubrobacteraceae bacterium]
MRVGLDLLFLTPHESGGRESYARELIPEMLAQNPELELVAFVNREAGAQLARDLSKEVRTVVLPISERNRVGWAVGELLLVSVAAARAKVELVHSMANFAPSWGPFRRVLTLHDLQYKALPELLSWPMRVGTSALVSFGAHRADRIIAVSRAGREEIVAGLGIEGDRIDVIPNGVRPPPSSPPSLEIAARLGVEGRAIALTVASNLPHKNLPVLIDALALIDPPRRPVLVLLGYGTDDPQLAARADAAGVSEDLRLLGARPISELESLYALARCLVLPTLHEGFGLPVLEAMARSLPVACSGIPALREIGGEAALYFDPRAPEQIAACIADLTFGDRVRDRAIELGHRQAAGFSWRGAASATLETYSRVLLER